MVINMKKTEFELPKVGLDEQELADLISTAMSDTCGFDWWKLEDDKLYDAARAELIAEGNSEDSLCFEQVWARILFNGGKLLLLESESDWHWKGFPDGTMLWNYQIRASGTEPEGGTWYAVGLDEICKGLSKYMADAGYATVQKLLENGDFFDADAVFQCAAYGEVQFG